jgi:hypothetical protein
LDGSPSCSWMALMPTSLGLGLTLDCLSLWLEIPIFESVSFLRSREYFCRRLWHS